MAVLALETVASATGGRVVSGDPGLTVDRYAIDSRNVEEGGRNVDQRQGPVYD